MKKRWFHDVDWYDVFYTIYNDPLVKTMVLVMTIDYFWRHFFGGQ